MKRVLIALILMVSAGLAAAGGFLYSSIKARVPFRDLVY